MIDRRGSPFLYLDALLEMPFNFLGCNRISGAVTKPSKDALE